jgi:Fe-S-cluster containining protein
MSASRQLPVLRDAAPEEAVDELRRDVAGGLLYCHQRANANTSRALEAGAFAYALLELLVEKGVLAQEEVEARKQIVGKRLVEKFNRASMTVELQDSATDKYAFQGGPRIDCEDRVALCKAACCRLRFPLSPQDLEQGIVKWELRQPYLIARGADGYCRHLDHGKQGCSVYEDRPLPCRAYDCRKDERIWADFERREVSPKLEDLFKS